MTLTNAYGPDIDLSDLLSKLSADGIDLNDPGNTVASAQAVRTPAGDIQVSIMDGEGRTVITGMLDPTPGSNHDHAVSWSVTSYDRISTATASNYGNTVETMSISALGHLNRVRSDAAGRTIQAEDAQGNISYAVYDNAGDTIRSRDANGVGQDCNYDARNRETSCTDTQGDTTTTTYNAASMVLNTTDGKNVAQAANNVYDAQGRLLASTTRLDSSDTTTRTYDPNGNLLSITDAEGGVTKYTYDPRNLRIATDYPDHVAGSSVGDAGYDHVSVSYDAAARPLVKTDQQGDTVVYLYDLASRLTERDYRTYANSTDSNSDGIPDGTVADSDTFTYDKNSRPLTATKGRYNNTVSFAYDAIGRNTTESLTVNFGTARTYVVTHAYDADNRETATTYPNGKIVNRSYTSRDQLGEVDYDGVMVANFTYDPGMRETQRTLGNGLDTRREYNRGDNLVTNIINETAPGAADRPDASFAYTYDANKNPTSETTGTTGDAMSGYSYTASYDAKDRLTGWNRANSIDSQLWSLTHVGDWSSTTINGTTQTRTHNAVHELTGIAGSSLQYDPKGDLTRQVGDTTDRFKWDFDNKMAAADVNQDGSDDLTFTYDALGRRVSKDDVATGTNTVYVCEGSQVVSEYHASDDPATTAPQQVYVYGIYVDEPLMKVDAANGKLYYHRNRQYCITAMTDASGNVVERYAYTAYGVTTILAPDGIAVRATSTVGNPYMYTGRRLDKEFATSSENAVYYYRARYYIPQLGRFIGRDPMGYVDGMNVYQYVGSRSARFTDSYGLSEDNESNCHVFSIDLNLSRLLEEMILDGEEEGAKKERLDKKYEPPSKSSESRKSVKSKNGEFEVEICDKCCSGKTRKVIKLSGQWSANYTLYLPPIRIPAQPELALRITALASGNVGGDITIGGCQGLTHLSGSFGGSVSASVTADFGFDGRVLRLGGFGRGTVKFVFSYETQGHGKCTSPYGCVNVGAKGSAAFGVEATISIGWFEYRWEHQVYKLEKDSPYFYTWPL